MLNLIKHELIKSKVPLILVIAGIVITEILCLISIALEIEIMFLITAMGLTMFCSFIPALCIIYPIYIFELDISHKHKNGYMLFMTPNSPYKIIGAKMLTSFIASAFVSLLLSGFFALNSCISIPPDYSEYMDFKSIASIFSNIPLPDITTILVMIISEYFQIISMLFFTYMIVITILERVPGKWIIGAGIFFATGYIKIFILNIVSPSITISDSVSADTNVYEIFLSAFESSKIFIINIIVCLIIGGLAYFGTSELCRKKLSI